MLGSMRSRGVGVFGLVALLAVLAGCGETKVVTVGGSVSGLAGTGFELKDDIGGELAVSANGSFAFKSSFPVGAAYAASVATQPSSPSQTCTITSGTGTAESTITSIRVDCVTNRFPIGGSIVGLVGTGLVLQQNGGDNQVIAAGGNGAFAFATSIESGSQYSITVLSQPSSPTQTCTVAHGNGTIGSLAVTDALVTCSTNTFTVSVAVSGLTGTGLVLQDNGGDDLPVTANGTYSFATHIASGSGFAITISNQPTNPHQTCAVFAGSGTVGSGNVTSVVNCASGLFTIGGTTSGLSGSVILRNNSGDDLTVSANGGFAFATPLAAGATYDVTVSTQPMTPSQVCTVSNGSGTVSSSSISSVQVNCVTNHFSIGGTVSGMTGTGLVIRNNGSDDLTVSGDGSFTFPTTIASGSGYTVSVSVQPMNPKETCVVSNGAGLVAGGSVSNVLIACTIDSFRISGSVSGLLGAGLVLQNNGGDDLAVMLNGTFSFLTRVSSNGTYAVTVRSSPSSPTQTCLVTGGNGAVTAADITTISVTCTTDRFLVGGAVTGLLGSGLVLQNDGGDDRAIGSDGSFAFATSVPSGQPFLVTVKNQPTSPGQTCTVNGGNGTIAAGNVTTVAVNCTSNHYTVGGTVSGLEGTIVLQNNSGDDLTVTSDGSFSFPTTAQSGDLFNVTIASHSALPSQTCSVSAPSGTVMMSDITSVSVTCSTNAFHVGFTVVGLYSNEAVFVYDNTIMDSLQITANGYYPALFSLIPSGHPYSVVVYQNPNVPLAQTCTVANSAGIMGASDVTNVVVTCDFSPFTVGGTVSGMAGSGLRLQLDGGSDLVIGGNGSFTFGTPVKAGSNYTVTVASQPNGPPFDQCRVASGAMGQPTNHNVTNVMVTCVQYPLGFSSNGASGRLGPTQAQVDSAGGGITWGVVVFNGVQNWTIPTTGTYQIEAWGAPGGNAGGHGADIRGDFMLTKGTVISVAVGQHGLQIGGGGGGTFVAMQSNVPLVVAGGGGGGADTSTIFAIADASLTTTGKTGDGTSGGIGGSGGNGGGASAAGGGGGFFANGVAGTKAEPGTAFVNGAVGGRGLTGQSDPNEGGFGGGGGSAPGIAGAGGGGGYSGGGAGGGNSGTGGGGASYNAGANQSNVQSTMPTGGATIRRLN